MRERGAGGLEFEDDGKDHVVPPRPPGARRPVAGALAALLVMALGVAIFGVISASRTPRRVVKTTATGTPTTVFFPRPAVSPLQVAQRGTGLPEGMEITSYAPTGPDKGWATGSVITNPMTGFPDYSVLLSYSAGSWTQVGPTLPGIFLGGIDMISPSEGWVMGGDDRADGLILHISDGAWTREALPTSAPQSGVDVMAMRTPDDGWAAIANAKSAYSGANTSLYHYAGGAWSQTPITIRYITDIVPIADGEAWVIGWNAGDTTSSLAHVQGGVATVVLTSPINSTFYRLRAFAPNDIWIEGAMHDASNASVNDAPLTYHYDGVAWSNVNLAAPQNVEHIGLVSGDVAWGYASYEPPPPNDNAWGQIASLYSNAGGHWNALSVPYKDLQSITVVSQSSADIWAIGVYMVTTRIPSSNGGASYSGVSHYVLLHYTHGAWTEYGR